MGKCFVGVCKCWAIAQFYSVGKREVAGFFLLLFVVVVVVFFPGRASKQEDVKTSGMANSFFSLFLSVWPFKDLKSQEQTKQINTNQQQQLTSATVMPKRRTSVEIHQVGRLECDWKNGRAFQRRLTTTTTTTRIIITTRIRNINDYSYHFLEVG